MILGSSDPLKIVKHIIKTPKTYNTSTLMKLSYKSEHLKFPNLNHICISSAASKYSASTYLKREQKRT